MIIKKIVDDLKKEIEEYPFSELSKQTLKKVVIEMYHRKVMNSLKDLSVTKHELSLIMDSNLKELDIFIENLDRHESIFQFVK